MMRNTHNVYIKWLAAVPLAFFLALAYRSDYSVEYSLLYLFGGPLLSPMFAGAAMSLSSVCVVGNALRLGTAKL